MEEERQQLQQVISEVVVGFLQAQDAWREEGPVLVHRHLMSRVPREEPKLENVLENHHHLQRSSTALGQTFSLQLTNTSVDPSNIHTWSKPNREPSQDQNVPVRWVLLLLKHLFVLEQMFQYFSVCLCPPRRSRPVIVICLSPISGIMNIKILWTELHC